MLTQAVRNVVAHCKRIQADSETLRKQNTKLAGEAQEKAAHNTVETARLKAVAEELATVKSMQAAICAENANSYRCAHNVIKGVNHAEVMRIKLLW